MRAIKYNGNLITFAGKILRMAEWVYQEGVHYLRVLAGGGTVPDRSFTEEYYKMAEENGMNDNIRLAVFPQSGYNKRESGIYKFVTRLFNLGNTAKYNATQLVTNGNFVNGTTGWVAAHSSNVVLNKILINTGTGTSSTPNFYRGISIGSVGDKYYGKCAITAKTSLCTKLRFAMQSPFVEINNPLVNNQYVLSGIITSTTSFSNVVIYHYYSSIENATGAAIEVGYVMAINLTATFGAGNEPSKEVCDVIFANYFDGTKETVLNDVTQGTAASQPYLFKKGIKNPNGGSRFMTHPTVSFAANEAWSVSVMLRWNFRDNASAYSGGGTNTTLRIRHGASTYPTHGISFRNDSGTNYISLADYKPYIGKNSHITFVADGTGNLKLYGNGLLLSSNSAVTNAVFSGLMNFDLARPYEGDFNAYFIRSGALTPSQVTAEYNLLSSYFPEISTVQVGSKHIATDNCEMVATPKGNVINLVNKETATETVLNGSFNTTDNWILDTANGVYIDTVNGKLVIPTVVLNSYATVAGQNVGSNYAGKLVLIKLVISEYVQGGLNVSPGNSQSIRFPILGNGTFYGLLNVTVGSNQLVVTRDYYTGFIGKIDEFSIREIGWNISDEIYNGIFNSTSGTVAQKTYAALKAAAMWRSPDNDLDKQAVFGKLYNGYTAQLLKLDIDTYNAENPTEPWGYHVASLSDWQSIKDSLGGKALAGKKIKIDGNEYWTSDNGDNTSGAEVLGSGYIDENGEYQDYRNATGFWTVTENGDMLEVVTLRDELDELFITE